MNPANDIALTEAFIDRVATSGDEAAAVKRVLGFAQAEARVVAMYAPERPPVDFHAGFDRLAHARAAVERYSEWVDSFPDDEPVPLARRERALRFAVDAVERLEAGAGG